MLFSKISRDSCTAGRLVTAAAFRRVQRKKTFLVSADRCDRPELTQTLAVRQKRDLLAIRIPTGESASFNRDLAQIPAIRISCPDVKRASA